MPPKKSISKKPYKKRAYKKKPKKITFEKRVLSVIHKQAETKTASVELTLTGFNSGVSSSADCIRVLPNIANGVLDNQRIGDQIRCQRLRIKGHILMDPATYQNYNSTRIGVRLLVVQPKMFAEFNYAQSNFNVWQTNLLKRGGTTVGFTGLISDLYSDVNTDAVTKLYDKVMYMNQPLVYSAAGAVDIGNTCKFFNISLKVKNKLLKYDQSISSAIQPTNYSPIFILGYSHLNGSAPDTGSTQISCAFLSDLYYEDM